MGGRLNRDEWPRAAPAGTLRQSWWVLAARRSIVVRAVKVCGLVGTLLVIINQGDAVVAGGAIDWGKLLLTYMVPYGVSTFSAVAALRAEHRGLAGR
jgi:hypothetical protein